MSKHDSNRGDSSEETRTAEQDNPRLNRRDLVRGGLSTLAVATAGAMAGGTAFGMPGGRELLVLKQDGLRGKVANLFALIKSDAEVKRIFINNPSHAVLSAILPKGAELPPQRLSESNRFLFSVLANAEFREWLGTYQAKLSERVRAGESAREVVNKGRVAQDLAQALARFGDQSTIQSLLERNQLLSQPEDATYVVRAVELYVETYVAVAVVIVLVLFAIDISPVTEGEAAADLKLTPGELRGIADQLIQHAENLKRSGQLSGRVAPIG
jgi:hypothetical protein